jgi:hypothetical protein
MTETWKPIEGFPGFDVSDLGRVRSWWSLGCKARITNTARVRKPVPDKEGYLTVNLRNPKTRKYTCLKIHRLVLESFVGPCPDGMECRHLDGDPGNCALTNLRWGTKLENAADRYEHGGVLYGERNHRCKLTDDQAKSILIDPRSHAELALVYGVSYEIIRRTRNGELRPYLQKAVSA